MFQTEEAADPVSFLSRPLQPAHGTSQLKVVWTSVVAAVQSIHFLPTVTCATMLFLLKLLQQTTVSAVPVFTGDFYGWSESDVSLFMTALSLAMFFVTVTATLGNGMVCTYSHSPRLLVPVDTFSVRKWKWNAFSGTFLELRKS
jgi:hypothetical protein